MYSELPELEFFKMKMSRAFFHQKVETQNAKDYKGNVIFYFQGTLKSHTISDVIGNKLMSVTRKSDRTYVFSDSNDNKMMSIKLCLNNSLFEITMTGTRYKLVH